MLDAILEDLGEVEGVHGAIVIDAAANVVAHRAPAIHDLTVLRQVARSVITSVDAVQLIQDDWEVLTAQFGGGKLLLCSLRPAGAQPRRYVLAVIADTTLNVAVFSVALRAATNKLVAELAAMALATRPWRGSVSGCQ
jgi:predicted regulator of Ras-like GTPase activity (Roadblock/LC7/MglB family)